MIITLGNIKGGVGKSTLACNIAVCMALSGKDILLIDGDKQGSSSDFTQARASLFGDVGYTNVRGHGKEIINQVGTMREKFEHIIIDAGGQDNPSLRAGVVSSDCVVVPVSPRSFETWALDNMVGLLEEASITNQKLKTFAVLNLAFPRGSDNSEAKKIIQKDYSNLTLLDGQIVQRKVFSDSIGMGKSIMEFSPKNSDAIAELFGLIKGIGLYQKDMEMIYNDYTK